MVCRVPTISGRKAIWPLLVLCSLTVWMVSTPPKRVSSPMPRTCMSLPMSSCTAASSAQAGAFLSVANGARAACAAACAAASSASSCASLGTVVAFCAACCLRTMRTSSPKLGLLLSASKIRASSMPSLPLRVMRLPCKPACTAPLMVTRLSGRLEARRRWACSCISMLGCPASQARRPAAFNSPSAPSI